MTRPGISLATLDAAGIREVNETEARALVGYAAPGIAIPYRTLAGEPLTFDGKAFHRLRQHKANGAKYLSPSGGGCQLYHPPGLRALLVPGCVLGIVEGEFKSMALAEAGFPCVGIGGITSACPRNDSGEPELLPDLAALIAQVRPSKVAFIGDSDTALIFDFAREAVKISTLAGVPVVLPRIPLDAPGKGPDDLRQVWGAEFAPRWQTILDTAEPVTPTTKPAALAVRLLRREAEALARLEADARDKARERLVKLAACLSGDGIAAADVEEIAGSALGLSKSVFRSAVKDQAAQMRRDAAERAKEQALRSLDADGPDPLYFDGNGYWRKEADGAYGKLCREDARLHLNKLGLSKTGDPSPCDAALHTLQVRNRVDYAGPLCGRPPGLHHENGLRVLATRGSSWIEGTVGDSPTINQIVANLFGRAAGDEHAGTEAALFVAWLKLGRQAQRNPSQHRPGQVLALVGPPDCGKSLLQSAIITPALGGRVADPGLFFTGQTTFNAELWGAEHLELGDKALDVDGTQRANLRNELKRVVAATVFPLHGKCRDGLTFRPVWRISLSANSDPESASNLPALDASFADKIIYLLCHSPAEPFYDDETPGAREAFAETIRRELPAFLASVDAFEIPTDLRKARFGCVEWHHPAILDLLDEGDPLRPVEEIVERWIDTWDAAEQTRELPTVKLYQALDGVADGSLARHKISSGVNHLGHQLAKLAATEGWKGRIEHKEWRRGGREVNAKERGWRVSR